MSKFRFQLILRIIFLEEICYYFCRIIFSPLNRSYEYLAHLAITVPSFDLQIERLLFYFSFNEKCVIVNGSNDI